MSESTHTRLSKQLGEAIEERIVIGRYPPGMRLDEQVLAAEFGVSRTPVREALIQLAAAGLVEMRPRRGAIVPKTDPARLCEMFEVMAELEALCGKLAARRISPANLEELIAAHQACEEAREAGDADRYYRLNEVFHHLIYAASQNAFLADQAAALHRRLRPYRRLQLRVRNRMSASFREHQAVIEAIQAGDGEAAAESLRAHVKVQGERFADLVASLSSIAQEAPPTKVKTPRRRPSTAAKRPAT